MAKGNRKRKPKAKAKGHTEADLEARLHATLKLAFPWWGSDSLSHQFNFSVRLGRAEIAVDGKREYAATGRADIVISNGGTQLAVVELKRADTPLTSSDVAQGLSYARLLEPMAPLVIISNGAETRIHLTYTGELLETKDWTEGQLKKRLENAGQLATVDVRKSIEVLMGVDQNHWVSAIRSVAKHLISDRSGNWDEPLAPFVHDFLIPRSATAHVVVAVNTGKRVIVVHGPPLSGKSNVLRELVQKAESSEATAVLLLEPNQAGIFKSLASQLSSELSWKVTADDAREWLRAVSLNSKAQLVIAVDGVDSAHQAVISELEDLASTRFGSQLRIVMTVDDAMLDAVMRKTNRREKTTLGRAAIEIPLLPLADGEFELATTELARKHIRITRGGESVPPLREPWVLRLLVPHELVELPNNDRQLTVRLPPLIDLKALDEIAAAFSQDQELAAALTRASRAVLAHYLDARKPAAVLQGLRGFSVAQHLLERELGQHGIAALHQRGFVKPGVDLSGNAVWFARLPTLIAAHIAVALADEMPNWGSADQVSKKLVTIASKLPFGSLAAARAIAIRIRSHDPGTVAIIEALLAEEPTSQRIGPGHRFAFYLHDTICEATLLEHGKLALNVDGRTQVIDWDPGETSSEIYDLGGWLILSNLAALPLGLQTSDATLTEPLDEALLEHIGRAGHILAGPEIGNDLPGISVHEVAGHGSVVCHRSGIVEPITWALLQFFLRKGSSATQWVERASRSQSLPLLSRTHIALGQLADVADARGKWAQHVLSDLIVPALRDLPMYH